METIYDKYKEFKEAEKKEYKQIIKFFKLIAKLYKATPCEKMVIAEKVWGKIKQEEDKHKMGDERYICTAIENGRIKLSANFSKKDVQILKSLDEKLSETIRKCMDIPTEYWNQI